MTKLPIALTILAVYLASCTARPATTKAVDSTLRLTIDFYPAFDSAVLISVRREHGQPMLLCTVHDGLHKSLIFSQDSVTLSEPDWRQYWQAVDTHELRSLQPRPRRGLDGMGILGAYKNADSVHRFYCWSPNRSDNAGVYQLLDPTFRLLYARLPTKENVIENVQDYLEYGLPVTIKSTKPFIAKLYGSLSWGCQADLQRFFATVPTDRSAILDLSNLHGMGTLFYSYFEQFDRAHPKMIWVVNAGSLEELLKIGIPTRKMVSHLSDALAKVK